MATTPEFKTPLSWSDPAFSLEPYNLIFLPGGHEKGVRQLIDSPIMAQHLGSYFPQTKKPSSKSVAAVCHGVLALAEAKCLDGEHKGKSVIHNCDTTALPGTFEQTAYWGTRLFLGDYYKTYGAGSEDVETAVSCSHFLHNKRLIKVIDPKETGRSFKTIQEQPRTGPVSSRPWP